MVFTGFSIDDELSDGQLAIMSVQNGRKELAGGIHGIQGGYKHNDINGQAGRLSRYARHSKMEHMRKLASA